MASKFWGGDSSSESESSDEETPMAPTNLQPLAKKPMARWAQEETSSDEEQETKRELGALEAKIKEMRHTSLEALKAKIKEMTNHQKINDFGLLAADYEALFRMVEKMLKHRSEDGPPNMFIRALVQAEYHVESLHEQLKEKGEKFPKKKQTIFNTLRSKIKKGNKQYQELVDKCKVQWLWRHILWSENEDDFQDSDESSSSESEEGAQSSGSISSSGSSDSDFDSDSSSSSDSSSNSSKNIFGSDSDDEGDENVAREKLMLNWVITPDKQEKEKRKQEKQKSKDELKRMGKGNSGKQVLMPTKPTNEEGLGTAPPAGDATWTKVVQGLETCMICWEPADLRKGVLCSRTPAHGNALLCDDCLQSYVMEFIGTKALQDGQGSVPCPQCLVDVGTSGVQPFVFAREVLEPRLQGGLLQQFQETLENVDEAQVSGSITELLNIVCPKCGQIQDPNPDGCVAMVCLHCREAYCWMCFQMCGRDAHAHAIHAHGTCFPSVRAVHSWHRRWRWRRIDRYLTETYCQNTEARASALQGCRVYLEDNMGLWPFPEQEPAVLIGGDSHDSAVMAAVQARSIDDLRAALDEDDAALHEEDDRGMTPLILASHSGQLDMVQLLLERGAQVDARDYNGTSSLAYACREGHAEVAIFLLEFAKHLDIARRMQEEALIEAARANSPRCAQLLNALLEIPGINVNASVNRKTPLQAAMRAENWVAARILLNHGEVDVNILLEHHWDEYDYCDSRLLGWVFAEEDIVMRILERMKGLPNFDEVFTRVVTTILSRKLFQRKYGGVTANESLLLLKKVLDRFLVVKMHHVGVKVLALAAYYGDTEALALMLAREIWLYNKNPDSVMLLPRIAYRLSVGQVGLAYIRAFQRGRPDIAKASWTLTLGSEILGSGRLTEKDIMDVLLGSALSSGRSHRAAVSNLRTLEKLWRSIELASSAALFILGQEYEEEGVAQDDERVDKLLRESDPTQQIRRRQTRQSFSRTRTAHAEHRANRVSQLRAERAHRSFFKRTDLTMTRSELSF